MAPKKTGNPLNLSTQPKTLSQVIQAAFVLGRLDQLKEDGWAAPTANYGRPLLIAAARSIRDHPPYQTYGGDGRDIPAEASVILDRAERDAEYPSLIAKAVSFSLDYVVCVNMTLLMARKLDCSSSGNSSQFNQTGGCKGNPAYLQIGGAT